MSAWKLRVGSGSARELANLLLCFGVGVLAGYIFFKARQDAELRRMFDNGGPKDGQG